MNCKVINHYWISLLNYIQKFYPIFSNNSVFFPPYLFHDKIETICCYASTQSQHVNFLSTFLLTEFYVMDHKMKI